MYSVRVYDAPDRLFTEVPLNATNDTEAKLESRGWFMGDAWSASVHRIDQPQRVGAWVTVDGEAAWVA